MRIFHQRLRDAKAIPYHGCMIRTPKQVNKDDASRRFVDSFDALLDHIVLNLPPPPSQVMSVSPPEGRALVWLGKRNSCVMSEFARGLGVPMSTATHWVDRLVEKGFLVRKRSDADRRVVQIELSEMGKRVDKRFYAHRLAASRKLLASLTQKEQEELIRLINKACE